MTNKATTQEKSKNLASLLNSVNPNLLEKLSDKERENYSFIRRKVAISGESIEKATVILKDEEKGKKLLNDISKAYRKIKKEVDARGENPREVNRIFCFFVLVNLSEKVEKKVQPIGNNRFLVVIEV